MIIIADKNCPNDFHKKSNKNKALQLRLTSETIFRASQIYLRDGDEFEVFKHRRILPTQNVKIHMSQLIHYINDGKPLKDKEDALNIFFAEDELNIFFADND